MSFKRLVNRQGEVQVKNIPNTEETEGKFEFVDYLELDCSQWGMVPEEELSRDEVREIGEDIKEMYETKLSSEEFEVSSYEEDDKYWIEVVVDISVNDDRKKELAEMIGEAYHERQTGY